MAENREAAVKKIRMYPGKLVSGPARPEYSLDLVLRRSRFSGNAELRLPIQ